MSDIKRSDCITVQTFAECIACGESSITRKLEFQSIPSVSMEIVLSHLRKEIDDDMKRRGWGETCGRCRDQ